MLHQHFHRGGSMRVHHVLFLSAFLFWQAAPTPTLERDSTGNVRLSFGAGRGRWEDASFDCDGNFIDSDPVDVRAMGARLDVEPSPGLRLTAAASVSGARTVLGPGWVNEPAMGVQVAWEGRVVGLGSGFTTSRLGEAVTAPNLYLRLGEANSVHFRLRVLEPNELYYVMPHVSLGLGWGRGRERRVGGFVGLGFGPYHQKGRQTVLAGELEIPAGQLDLLLRAQQGSGYDIPQWAVGAGLRYHLR
jgi:hypothetical protein